MQVSGRFTIAIQMLTCISVFSEEEVVTSEFLASSVNVNPVIIRKIMQQLKAADIVTVRRGQGGAFLSRDASKITLEDVFNAVESLEDGQLFHFHDYPNPNDSVGRNIHAVLDARLERIQNAMEQEMRSMSIADLSSDIRLFIARDAAEREKRRAQYDL